MIERSYRPLYEEERRELEAIVRYRFDHDLFDTLGAGCAFFIFGVLILGIPIAMISNGIGYSDGLVFFLSGLFAVIVGFPVALWYEHYSTYKSCRKDLKEDRVAVTTVKANTIVELKVASDHECLCYLFDVGGNKILFLYGDYLCDYAWGEDWRDEEGKLDIEDEEAFEEGIERIQQRGDFPNSHFRISETCHSHHIFNLECFGRKLPIKKTLDERDFAELALPEDGHIFTGAIEEVEQILENYQPKKSGFLSSQFGK